MGAHAFENCTSLTSFEVPLNLTNFYPYAFANSGLTSFYIQNMDEDIGGMFTISKPVMIGDHVFAGCTALTTVEMNFVESDRGNEANIGVNAFSGCTQLSSVTLTGMLETIEAGAFANCTALKAITLPAPVTTVAATAFSGWQEDQTITVPYASEDALPGSFAAGWSAGAAVVYNATA